MRSVLLCFFLTLGSMSPALAQTRTPQQIADDLLRISGEVAQLQPALPPAPVYVEVPPGGDVQAALNLGGEVRLVNGGIYNGPLFVPSNTTLNLMGAKVVGTTTEAVIIKPSTVNATVKNGVLTSSHSTVLRCGHNGSAQTTEAQIPKGITVSDITIPSHRGMRGIEFHCEGDLINNNVLDVWNTNGTDTQGLFIMTGRNIRVLGGHYQAGSENILVGGDLMKIPGFVPSNIFVEGVTLDKPLSWRTDGIKRKIKNLFELKTGKQVTLRASTLDGSWTDGQEGWGIVITPHSGGDIHDVIIEDNTIKNVATGFDIMGKDYGIPADAGGMIPTPAATSGLIIRRNYINASKTMTGRGILAVIVAAPADVTFDSNIVVTDGTSMVIYDQGSILTPELTNVPGGPMGVFKFTNNFALPSNYGFAFQGNMNGANIGLWAASVVVTGNTFGDPTSSVFKTNFPSNTYITRANWDALVAGM